MRELGALIVAGWGPAGERGLFATHQLLAANGVDARTIYLPTSDTNVVDVDECRNTMHHELRRLIDGYRRRVVVAFSMGGMFALDAAASLKEGEVVDLGVFIAPWTDLKKTSPGSNFSDRKLSAERLVSFASSVDYRKARRHIGQIEGVLSKNDPFVIWEQEQSLIEGVLGGRSLVLDRAGHFLKSDFPFLPPIIERFMENPQV